MCPIGMAFTSRYTTTTLWRARFLCKWCYHLQADWPLWEPLTFGVRQGTLSEAVSPKASWGFVVSWKNILAKLIIANVHWGLTTCMTVRFRRTTNAMMAVERRCYRLTWAGYDTEDWKKREKDIKKKKEWASERIFGDQRSRSQRVTLVWRCKKWGGASESCVSASVVQGGD